MNVIKISAELFLAGCLFHIHLQIKVVLSGHSKMKQNWQVSLVSKSYYPYNLYPSLKPKFIHRIVEMTIPPFVPMMHMKTVFFFWSVMPWKTYMELKMCSLPGLDCFLLLLEHYVCHIMGDDQGPDWNFNGIWFCEGSYKIFKTCCSYMRLCLNFSFIIFMFQFFFFIVI